MRIVDWAYRTLYRHGFRAARLVWRVTQPVHTGALVMLWVGNGVLLVRSSYQEGWMAPGGGVGRRETPFHAAVREMKEELGLEVAAADLRPSLVVEHIWNHRRDTVHFFEWRLETAPAFQVDRRELVEARFFTLLEAQTLRTAPHLRDYFQMRAEALPMKDGADIPFTPSAGAAPHRSPPA